MSRLKKRGAPPKHLERTLFINHKEDQLLGTRLHELTLESRLRSMEMDRERIKVRNEWRNSRKKQITISEAISTGLIPENDLADSNTMQRTSMLPKMETKDRGPVTSLGAQADRRVSISAPSRRQSSVSFTGKPPLSRSSTCLQPQGQMRIVSTNQFAIQPLISEKDEYGEIQIARPQGIRRDSAGSVGLYVLDEFQKMSEVVPGILRALAKKKEQQVEADEKSRLREMKDDINVGQVMENLINYEPDMNKVRKTVSSVKQLRHRMAISKKLEKPRPQKSLDQMIKEKTENLGEHDQYTDGTCALMKRRLEKKRRESAPFAMEPSFMQRRGSTLSAVGEQPPTSRRGSLAPDMSRRGSLTSDLSRRGSVTFGQFPQALTRSSTSLSLGGKHDEDSPFIDEDVLVKRQRVMSELGKFRLLKDRVDQFLVGKPTNVVPVQTVIEEIIQIK